MPPNEALRQEVEEYGAWALMDELDENAHRSSSSTRSSQGFVAQATRAPQTAQ